MLRPVMQQVAPLAERSDVAVLAAAMRRVVVEMGLRQLLQMWVSVHHWLYTAPRTP